MISRCEKDALEYGTSLFDRGLILEALGGVRKECYHIVLVVLVSQLSVLRALRTVVANQGMT